MNNHAERVYEYGETCEICPCDECGFIGQDMKALKAHMESGHSEASTNERLLESGLDDDDDVDTENILPWFIVNKRIPQNLKDVNLEEDSDEEWDPSQEEDDDESEDLPKSKRKQAENKSVTNLILKRKLTVPDESQPRKKSRREDRENGLYCELSLPGETI